MIKCWACRAFYCFSAMILINSIIQEQSAVAQLVKHKTGEQGLLVGDSPESLCCFLEQDT